MCVCLNQQGSAVADKPALLAASRQTAKFENGHVTITRIIYVILLVTLGKAYLCKKLDDSSFSYSCDMIGVLKFKLDHVT